MPTQQQVRTLTDAEVDEMRRRAGEEAARNEQLQANAGTDTGTRAYDTIVVTGNGLRGQSWAGDTVDTIARAWVNANPGGMTFRQVRTWILQNNRHGIANAEDCLRNASLQPEIYRGQTLRLPEGNEITNLNWKYVCPLPLPPVPNEPAAPPIVAAPPPPPVAVEPPPPARPVTYPYQATSQNFVTPNSMILAYEIGAATGEEEFVNYYRRPDIAALEGSRRTPRSGMPSGTGGFMNQGPRRDDTPLSERDNGSPRLTEERHLTQGQFYGGNLLTDEVDGRRVANTDAQTAFLDARSFNGNDDHDWVAARTGIPFISGTREPRNDMNIGQTSTTPGGSVQPTYTLSSEDFVNRDIWFFNNPARTSGPIGTYDRYLAYVDYRITSREFREGSQSIMARLEGGDQTITRADVQRVFNAGNYAQMNVLVRDAGIDRDLQTVMSNINTRFANYQWPATDQSPALVLRDGTSPDILNTNVQELGGYRIRVASRERFDELADRYGAGFRFDGFRGIEGQEIAGAYRVIHQRPTAVGAFVGENRATLTAGTPQETQQRTTAALNAVLGTAEAPNGAGASALWAQAADRPEIATAMVNTLSRAYNNPTLYGFRDRNEVAQLVVGLTGQPTEAQRSRDGNPNNNGDRGRNATDDAIGSRNGGGLGTLPLAGGYLNMIQSTFGNNEGRMINPQAFARLAAGRVANSPELQAATARLYTTAPLADQVALLQTVASDPRVETNFGPGQSSRALAAASGASLDRNSPFFQGLVTGEVYSREDYSDVSVSARGYVDDVVATAAARENGGPVVRSANDYADVDSALESGDRTRLMRTMLTGPAAVASGAPRLVVESLRYNPAMSANVMTATMLRDPGAFDQPIRTLRELDGQYRGGSLPLVGNLFGLLDADQFGQAASALESSQRRVARLDAATLDAARNGDQRALRRVDDAMSPWNDFEARMMSNPNRNSGFLRYAAHEQVWDAIARDDRARGAIAETLASNPQFAEASWEILRLTPMQRNDMRENQFIGRPGGSRGAAIPSPISGPAIDAAGSMYVSFDTGRNGRVSANVNAGALVAPAAATVAATEQSTGNSAAGQLAAGGSINVISPTGATLVAGAGAPGAGQPAGGVAAGAPAGGVNAGAPAGGQPAGGVAAGAPAGGQPAGGVNAGAPSGGQPAGGVNAGAPAGGQPAGGVNAGAPAGGQPAGGVNAGAPAGGQPAGGVNAGAPAGGTPAGGGAVHIAAGGNNPAAGVVASVQGAQAAGAVIAASGTYQSSTTGAAPGLPGGWNPITPEMAILLIPHGGGDNPDLIPDIVPGCGGVARPVCDVVRPVTGR